MSWNVLDFKEYMLSTDVDCIGQEYAPEERIIADKILQHYTDAELNPNKIRVDLRPAYAVLNPFFAGQGFGV